MAKIIGFFETCNEVFVSGWIADETNPDQYMDIDIVIDNELVTNVTANLFRQDLLDANIGNGNYAFNVLIPKKFKDGIEHKVEVREAITGVLIPGNPKTFISKKLQASIDACDEKGIVGWAVDMSKPHVPVKLEVLIDGALVAKTVANIFRKDLLDAKLGNGNCAFHVRMPDKFWDGIEHSVTIHETVTKMALPSSPKKFQIGHKFVAKTDNRIKLEEVEILRRQLQELKKENEVLLLQLHKIQEELERYYLQEQKTDELRFQVVTLTQERDDLAELLKKVKYQFEHIIAILNIAK